MKKLVVALDDYADEMEQWAKKGIAGTTMAIYNTAVSLAPVDMGFLRESIDFKFENGGMTGIISVGAEYAIYVEFGTGIFATQGSKAKKIPWTYKNADGEWVTTYGSPAQPFWFPALDAGERYFNKYFS
ncbi:HK97-gp10 family putative phage morphogenesis protein [Macrococcus bovicus]|uniref:HK97 gp10 family phage protein n=1 Tax=Macrococcus bovicus TaxID=69968 RepID=A0A4R6BWG1_9STAP|nr:HK97-gp10 family putative phage morphogenesis protein [Macrococcus bovicus]TDM12658.1 HK97 gp10 family phage protein [Macrococcus bovicus]